MGSISDMNDVDRFLRSREGKEHLEGIRRSLKGKAITEVDFSNEVTGVAIVLYLDDGSSFVATQPELDVDVLREDFAEALEREYYKDYPDRKPEDSSDC